MMLGQSGLQAWCVKEKVEMIVFLNYTDRTEIEKYVQKI